ncbi:MAG: hypothetical protein GY795_00200 [Desulfobacterales bacterium]|nr:hypothetical protein [Desulfobacterales bacterium]
MFAKPCICEVCRFSEGCNILSELRKSEEHTSGYDLDVYVRQCNVFSKVTFDGFERKTIGFTVAGIITALVSIVLAVFPVTILTEFQIKAGNTLLSLTALIFALTASARAFFVSRKSGHLRIRRMAKTVLILNCFLILVAGILTYIGTIFVLKNFVER